MREGQTLSGDYRLVLAEVLREAQSLNKAGRFQRLVELVEGRWDELGAVPPSRAGADLCRITMLAHYRLGANGGSHEHYLRGYVWRVRALVRAAASGWTAGILVLAQTEALRVQWAGNMGLPVGSSDYAVVPQAAQILDEFEPYADIDDAGDSPLQPSPRVVGRMLYEQRAFLNYLAGDYEAAVTNYDVALDYAGEDERAELKVLAARASAIYAGGDAAQRVEALDILRDIASRCVAGGYGEIARIADENLARFTANRDDLLPYESV